MALITTASELRKVCKSAETATKIAFDTEFIREHTYYPKLALIQVATESDIMLVDPTMLSPEDMAPLLDLFTNPNILKIMHAAQADQECLWTTYQCLAAPVFDTSVAASLLGLGDQIGLGHLIELILGITLAKGHSRTNWLARPLPPELIQYAKEDVLHLLELSDRLDDSLKKHGRSEWALQLSAEWSRPERFSPDPMAIAQKIAKRKRLDAKGASLLTRLVEWRESLARTMNIPKRRVADDQALLDIACARPKSNEQLHSFRGIHRGVLSDHATTLLALCRDTSTLPGVTASQNGHADGSENKLSVELFQYFVRTVAAEHHLSARHLLDRASAEKIVSGKFETSQEWVAAGLISSDIHALIGETLWNFLTGRCLLGLKNGRPIIHDAH